MIRILLDQGVPHSALPFLRAAGFDVVHVFDMDMQRASDSEILIHARSDNRVVCTLDADFHALLATSGHSTPSVVRIRQEGLKGQQLAKLLIDVWPRIVDFNDDGRHGHNYRASDSDSKVTGLAAFDFSFG